MSKLIEQLQSLEIQDLITQKKNDADLEYAFKHVFTQESVYNSLLRSDRHQLHQRVGEALEALLGDKLEDQALLLAYHFERGKNQTRALKYLKIAAMNASKSYANQEARELYSRALALLDKDDYSGRWDLLAEREQILNRLGEREQQATDLTLMQTLAELMADDRRLATTHNRRAAYFDKISEYQAAAEAAAVGLRIARRAGNSRLEAQSLNLLALAAWRRFDYREVQKWANQALDALRVAGDPVGRITSLLHLGRASYRLGQYDAALNYIQAAQELATDTDNRDSDALADLILGWIYQRLGYYDRAKEHYQLNLDKRCLIGDRYGEATALSHLGWLAYDQQQCQEGLRYCLEALDISQTISDRENQAYALGGLALNHEHLDNLDIAKTNYEEALVIHQEIGATTLAIFDQAGLARIALGQQNPDMARQYITNVVEWIRAGKAQQFWDPWFIYQSAYQVLTTLAETDVAWIILDEAHTLLHQRAKEISDPELRRYFLENVTVNQAIERAWQTVRGDG